ncbi:MAG: hypothetical protein J2P48_18990 [Alphaproteobacteria bacterium]|nr:hypothetical protein [Alphaproteobacteria bacterium]
MTIICRHADANEACDSGLPPDVKPMLAHLAIVSEMMRTCGHVRPDLAAPLHDAWAAWQVRNARVLEILDTLRQDADRANSPKRAPPGAPLAKSRAEASELVMGYEALKETLQHQVEDQVRKGNMRFVGNCDEVLAKFSSGRLDYHTSEK